jgi:hypothetical protein
MSLSICAYNQVWKRSKGISVSLGKEAVLDGFYLPNAVFSFPITWDIPNSLKKGVGF